MYYRYVYYFNNKNILQSSNNIFMISILYYLYKYTFCLWLNYYIIMMIFDRLFSKLFQIFVHIRMLSINILFSIETIFIAYAFL